VTFLAVFATDDAPVGPANTDASALRKPNLFFAANSNNRFRYWIDQQCANSVGTGMMETGQLQIVGRVRLDRRSELSDLLGASRVETDLHLCLRAYTRWGYSCVEHLRGDFTFAIWDETQQCLFCARDQLGVRPFFYKRVGTRWIMSDSFETLVEVSATSEELDPFWIADFLTKPFSVDLERTVYKNVKRLAPGHSLVITRNDIKLRKYWQLEFREPILYRKSSDYTARFHELLDFAVEDRLPNKRVGISMSGGLDSTTLAAKCVEITGDPTSVVALTGFFKRLPTDSESHLSSLVARHLGIEHVLFPVDDLYGASQSDPSRVQEPGCPGTSPLVSGIQEEQSKYASVWLYGEGPDNALTFEWRAFLRGLQQRRSWWHFIDSLLVHFSQKDAREWIHTFRRIVRGRSRSTANPSSYTPPWLTNELAECLKAREVEASPPEVPWKPEAVGSFTSGIWPAYFETWDPAISRSKIDVRHPFVDLELLDFMLRIPPIPWARRKYLIREAMRGRLPQEVLAREKTPLLSDPYANVRMGDAPIEICSAMRRFVDADKFQMTEQKDAAREKVRVLDSWVSRCATISQARMGIR
jgi:asparagine synthase (glutamine-hydrolysing)